MAGRAFHWLAQCLQHGVLAAQVFPQLPMLSPPWPQVVAGHCTGWRAQAHLIHTLPGRCMPSSVGHTYSFRAPA